MLFRQDVLERIATGEITLAFRSWRRPTVRSGGTLRTAVGVLAIEEVHSVVLSGVTEDDARRAGFASLDALQADLASQREGELYRIQFSLAGADPRVALRENADWTDAEIARVEALLQRVPVLRRLLAVLRGHERRRAIEIARELGSEKEIVKREMRKLKELGLTVSLADGYRLSPRGEAFLDLQLTAES